MNKALKEAIAKNKLSDEQLLALINSNNQDSESQDESEDSDAPETPAGGTADGTKDTFTMDELNAMIAKGVEAAMKTKAAEQPDFIPKVKKDENAKPLYRVLKMK